MSRVLQPHPEGGFNWIAAFVLSAVLHAGVAVVALDLIPFSAPDAPPPVSFPDIAISSAALQSQQLAALEPEDAEEAEADTAEEPDRPEAEDLPATESEELEQAEVEEIDPTEADALAEAEAEALAQAEADALEAAASEELAQAETEALNAAETEELAAVAPEQVSPILPDSPAAEAVAPQAASPPVAPVTPDSSTTSIQGATLAPVAAAPAPAAPVVSSAQTVARVAPVAPPPAPAAPAPTPAAAPPPSPEDLAVQELIERIRNRFDDTCLIALPQNQGAGLNPLVTMISDEERSISRFASEVLSDPDLPVDERRILVDSRQCAALDFARAHRNYPAFRIDLTLQSRAIASGNNLRGQIRGFGARYTSILAVDSNGVVTDLRRFTQFQQGTALLDAPVNINGAPRDTSHLLFAIATPGLPSTVAQRAGWLAEDFFPSLREEIEGRALLAILPFDVR